MSSFVRRKKNNKQKKRKDTGIRKIVFVISSPQRAVKKDLPQNKGLKKNQGLFSVQADGTLDNTAIV